MLQRFFFTAAAVLLLAAPAAAQSPAEEYRYEVGAVFTAIGADDSDSVQGLGVRFGYNLTEHFAVDAETAFFPSDRLGNNLIGQNAQGFVGLKAGARTKYVGLFAKARPGVMFIGSSTSGFDCSTRGGFELCRPERSHLALDAGLVAEFYPTRRAIIRLDVGDTIIRFRQAGRNFFDGAETGSTDLTHNLQVSVGFGYRF